MHAALELKKQADAGVLSLKQQTAASVGILEGERVQLQNVGIKLEQYAGHAIQGWTQQCCHRVQSGGTDLRAAGSH